MDSTTRFDSWQCTDPLHPTRYREIVREMNLRGNKWDTQLGDTATLAPYALTIPRSEWQCLAALAEALSRELLDLEQKLQYRADLWPSLGLPRSLIEILNGAEPWTPSAARIVRYDFHPTAAGWRISEVNSDVPGGFNEASTFTQLMAGNFTGLMPAADPLDELTTALSSSMNGSKTLALLAAPGYTEDWQIISGLSASLNRQGMDALPARPEQLVWENGRAFIRKGGKLELIGSIYRFYQGEWLARLPVEKWRLLLRGGLTPVCNPAISILSESKRLPLLWSELQSSTKTWASLLPETQRPKTAICHGLAGWVLKPAYCNTGDSVIGRRWQSNSHVFFAAMKSLLQSRSWVAQKCFQSLTVPTPQGPMYPCLGVYTINSIASGIYARFSPKRVVDYLAHDVAILLRD